MMNIYLVLVIIFALMGFFVLMTKNRDENVEAPSLPAGQTGLSTFDFTAETISNNINQEITEAKNNICEQTANFGYVCLADVYPTLPNITQREYLEMAGTKTLIGQRNDYWIECTSISMYPALNCYDTYVAILPYDRSAMKTGDIILFQHEDSDYPFITHRIVRVVKDNEGIFYTTKGDYNKQEDPYAVRSYHIKYQIVGRYVG